jgi:type VI secretion system FHA domain protein
MPVSGDSAAEWNAFLRACGVEASELRSQPQAAMGAAGGLLRRLIAGLVVMLEARTRAKAQLGAQGTSLELHGNNPLKFARSPERALAQMLNPPERGFMSAEQAVEDAFKDLQAHQMAILAAMQSALGATLARFSPEAIRGRAETRGLLAKILPSAREAELWNAYEREFEGVARGSDEAFMDIFAKQFRLAYETAAAEMKQRGR